MFIFFSYTVYILNAYIYSYNIYVYLCSVLGPSTQASSYPLLYVLITRHRPPIEIWNDTLGPVQLFSRKRYRPVSTADHIYYDSVYSNYIVIIFLIRTTTYNVCITDTSVTDHSGHFVINYFTIRNLNLFCTMIIVDKKEISNNKDSIDLIKIGILL